MDHTIAKPMIDCMENGGTDPPSLGRQGGHGVPLVDGLMIFIRFGVLTWLSPICRCG